MKATRSSAPLRGLAAAALLLGACEPGAPPGVDKAALDEAVSRAIGDPNSCVLIARRSDGKVLYRYNSATACAREWPACDRPGMTRISALAEATAKDGRPRLLSCNSAADGSRGVGWAAGPVAGKDLVYAAVMEGDRVLPGRIIASKLEAAFRRAKVSE